MTKLRNLFNCITFILYPQKINSGVKKILIKNETLEKWLIQLRKIIEHRELGIEKNIKKIKKLYEELLFLVSNEYLNYEEDVFKLQMDLRYARFIEEVINRASYYLFEVNPIPPLLITLKIV